MTMDLMPTYLELAGSKAPGPNSQRALDGRTLGPVLFEGLPMPERTLFWRKGKEWAVRHGPWKLIAGENGELMLFNLDNDIAEQRNLVKDRPDLVEKLLAAYRDWDKDVSGKI